MSPCDEVGPLLEVEDDAEGGEGAAPNLARLLTGAPRGPSLCSDRRLVPIDLGSAANHEFLLFPSELGPLTAEGEGSGGAGVDC